MKRPTTVLAATTLLGSILPILAGVSPAAADVTVIDRSGEAVVLTGRQVPSWSRLSAQGLATPNPFGQVAGRDAHAGILQVPPDPRSGVPVNEIAAYSWTGDDEWKEVPVQVDQLFPYFLANQPSDFSVYSWTDEELTYQWDNEAWKKTGGQCTAQYPDGQGPTPDPVQGLDDDDEISFYASDASSQPAPEDAPAPTGAILEDPDQPGFRPRQEVRLVDPNTQSATFLYLFLTEQGSSFNASNGYVDYQRDPNADQWIDRNSFADDDPEKLGTSNTPYGPNLEGDVCDPNGSVRHSTDRFPRDGMTVSTRTYQVHASGRWMVRSTKVTAPGTTAQYGEDLIDRWKGRAFQQNPDSSISLVGFEDEQVNWEANSALLGERKGPVRAIREVWGADSGTNTTKTEYYYRDYYVFRYHLRVHPIPPDGIYTSWDNNAGAVTTYYDEGLTRQGIDGVEIDGQDDEKVGNINQDPVLQRPMFFDVTDPTFAEPLAFFNWEEVSGENGSLVYMFQLNDAKDVEEPLIIPYYRDDACFDDGTGDDPVPRPWPGEASTDPRVQAGYSAANGGTPYPDLRCDQKQGAFASHGVHFLFTSDTDNAFLPKATTEVDGQQYVWAVPTDRPTNVGDQYANTVKFPLTAVITSQDSAPSKTTALSLTLSKTAGGVRASATLVDEESREPVAGKTITFFLEGSQFGQPQTTDQGGRAAVTIPKNQVKKGQIVAADFRGDDTWGGSHAERKYTG